MGDALKKFQKHAKKLARDKERPLSGEERKALHKLRKEARQHGTKLASGGKGGLPPSFVLNVMRRDDYQCKVCGGRDQIGLHHKGGIVESKWLSMKGHKLDANNVVTICDKCHDRIHQKARAEGVDSSQVTPEGDEGTRRDHGKPEAHPPS